MDYEKQFYAFAFSTVERKMKRKLVEFSFLTVERRMVSFFDDAPDAGRPAVSSRFNTRCPSVQCMHRHGQQFAARDKTAGCPQPHKKTCATGRMARTGRIRPLIRPGVRDNGLCCQFIAPFSAHATTFSGFSLVDDTDLIIVRIQGADYHSVLTQLQVSVDTWEGCLKATCGAIVPKKSFWFLIDFAWQSGNWKYKTVAQCPGELSVKDLQGNRHKLRRHEVHNAQETLGIFLAPDGNLKAQFNKMLKLTHKWADNMRT
jgi:hypothetical protein